MHNEHSCCFVKFHRTYDGIDIRGNKRGRTRGKVETIEKHIQNEAFVNFSYLESFGDRHYSSIRVSFDFVWVAILDYYKRRYEQKLRRDVEYMFFRIRLQLQGR